MDIEVYNLYKWGHFTIMTIYIPKDKKELTLCRAKVFFVKKDDKKIKKMDDLLLSSVNMEHVRDTYRRVC